jgi:hypothetical protein
MPSMLLMAQWELPAYTVAPAKALTPNTRTSTADVSRLSIGMKTDLKNSLYLLLIRTQTQARTNGKN